MKAVLKKAAEPGVEYVTDAAEPVAAEGHVVIEVAAASLCGTDRECYEWSPAAQAFAPDLPVVLGHEGAGTVVEVGPGVTGLRAGDRVALESHMACGQCFACATGHGNTCERTRVLGMHTGGVFAERAAVPAGICVQLPDGVPLETGALLESAGVAVHAVQRAGRPIAGRGVVVSGGGPVGLVTAHLALRTGAAFVVVVEPNPFRRERAEQLGAIAVEPGPDAAERCRELAGRRGGAEVAFECSGVSAALPPLFDAVGGEGVVITVGNPSSAIGIDVAAHINKKGITLRGVFGRELWETWEQALLLLDSGRLDLDWLITHRLPLAEIHDALELLTGDACKVVLTPGLH